MILEGTISIPYKWTTGTAVGRFLSELRDHGRLLAARCPVCLKAYVPPTDLCGVCFRPLTDWVELEGGGTVIATSIVYHRAAFGELAQPHTIALIKLDGADTNLVHFLAANVEAGTRVRPLFKARREGSILDLECFVAIQDP